MVVRMLLFFILYIMMISARNHTRSLFKTILKILPKNQCEFYAEMNVIGRIDKLFDVIRNVNQITDSWRKTFPNGNYQTNTKNLIPFDQMELRDPDTILRMAEYQTMVCCTVDDISYVSDISLIMKMAEKNLRVGNFTIEVTGFDSNQTLLWYIASNIAQKSILFVHRGTRPLNHDDILDDFSRATIDNSNSLFSEDFPFLSVSKDVYVHDGFYRRFQREKLAIITAVRQVLNRFSDPSFSFIVLGHSMGAVQAFLNAGYFTTFNDINQRMKAIYTFSQPLFGSASFVNDITKRLNTPIERYIRVVNRNDFGPRIGCDKCIQPEYANEKWIMNTKEVIWKDCQGGQDPTCSLSIPCRELSWTHHNAVGELLMHRDFCDIASND